jgi:hypothetical protein
MVEPIAPEKQLPTGTHFYAGTNRHCTELHCTRFKHCTVADSSTAFRESPRKQPSPPRLLCLKVLVHTYALQLQSFSISVPNQSPHSQ